MSGIIKSGSADESTSVRAIVTFPIAPPAAVVDVERERLKRRLAELEGELRQRDGAIAELRRNVDGAERRGRIIGREEGLADAQDRQNERLEILAGAVSAARRELSDRLQAIESLAVSLAHDGLEIVFANAGERGELVADAIRAQVAKLDKDLVLTIEVSAEDFASAGLLAERLGVPAAMVTLAQAASGHCLIGLRLGRMDVGIDRQWGRLRELLVDMTQSAEAT
ncbi:MAG: hypothetical protein WDN01_14260 [Rhizomicrobium sp.]